MPSPRWGPMRHSLLVSRKYLEFAGCRLRLSCRECSGYCPAKLANELQPTKRNVVSTVSRFYDTMGFLTPVVIRFKVLFQRLCRAKVDWDQPLTGELLREWSSLVSYLQGGTSYLIPRHLFSGCSYVLQILVDQYHFVIHLRPSFMSCNPCS